ncbi:MAG: cytidine deaminase [Betaproteobacteria bacterium]
MNDAPWQTLADAAKAACRNAYSSYSGFPVGAAVLTDSGTVAKGCNVENASYGLTICAERSAVFGAITDGARAIVALALYTPTAKPVTPCGACLQVIAEFGANVEIRSYCDGPDIAKSMLRELLPASFTLPGGTNP